MKGRPTLLSAGPSYTMRSGTSSPVALSSEGQGQISQSKQGVHVST